MCFSSTIFIASFGATFIKAVISLVLLLVAYSSKAPLKQKIKVSIAPSNQFPIKQAPIAANAINKSTFNVRS